jgi:quinol monooxygenase YgiN
MARFAQQTRLLATAGNADALVAKFAESAEIQQNNPACELMITGTSTTEADVVYLVEVWSSEEEWETARTSPAITAWAQGMPQLVAGPPQSVRLGGVSGKGLRPGSS